MGAATTLDLRNAEVSHYGPNASGGRPVRVEWPGIKARVEVQVRPLGAEDQADADELANMIAMDVGEVSRVRTECRAQVTAAVLRRKDAERSVDLMTAPGQRFFGAVLVRPLRGNDWTGAVCLVDPVKGFGGFGFEFPSLVDLWRSMPDLRPESAGQDETGPWIKVVSLQIKAPASEVA